ncbi:MAG: TPM domain-containing protein [Planctomycetota bacterium]|nr:TPM domain-containing protein [Planctomycetota bacterium]
MKALDSKREIVRMRVVGLIALSMLLAIPAATFAQQPKPAVPDYEGEFFTDLTHGIPARVKVDISRILRMAHRKSHVHGVLVVMNAVEDYPGMPQDFKEFTAKLFNEWKIGDADTHKAVLVVFSIHDRKFGVNHSKGLPQSLSDKIRKDMVPGVTNALKANDIGKAMQLAAEVVSDNLPNATPQAGTRPAGAPVAPTKHITQTTRERRSLPPSGSGSHTSGGSSFGGLGCFGLMIGAFILFAIVSAISGMFSGRRHGYGRGMGGGYYGGDGGGGFMSGMLTGGLMGYMFSNSGHNHGSGGHGSHYGGGDFTETTTTESWSDGGGGGGFGDSGGGGFDTFGGSDMDGGSFGEW